MGQASARDNNRALSPAAVSPAMRSCSSSATDHLRVDRQVERRMTEENAEGPRFEAPRRRKQVAKLEGKINRAGAGSGPTTRVETIEGERRRNRLRR